MPFPGEASSPTTKHFRPVERAPRGVWNSKGFRVDDEFNASVACPIGRALVVGYGIVVTVIQGKQLAYWHLIAASEVIEYRIALSSCQLMVR